METAPFIRLVALALAALLPIINPPGTAPIFLSMTAGASAATRAALARKVAIYASVLLAATLFAGSYVLTFFGLSLAVIKIAGGLVLIAAGWQLVASESIEQWPPGRASASDEGLLHGIGFFPLTFPLTIGPGSLSVAITFGADTRGHDAALLLKVTGFLTAIAIVGVAIYLCYRFASRVVSALGRTGTTVLLRLSAFILLAVGVQIFCDGLSERFAILRSLA